MHTRGSRNDCHEYRHMWPFSISCLRLSPTFSCYWLPPIFAPAPEYSHLTTMLGGLQIVSKIYICFLRVALQLGCTNSDVTLAPVIHRSENFKSSFLKDHSACEISDIDNLLADEYLVRRSSQVKLICCFKSVAINFLLMLVFGVTAHYASSDVMASFFASSQSH
ncbi:hypothetical protein IWZ01DRAFT_501350 [Phyllosticta capitalensis]